EIFHRGAVQALAEDGPVTPTLATLVRKGLIRPDRSRLLADEGFRFHHVLLRDAAYDALTKSARADLHERFAHWFEEKGAEVVELDELLGYHLEQAAGYRAELGRPDAELAAHAASRLGAAGHRARLREDLDTARSLLQRALDLSPQPDVHLVVDLVRS